MAGKASCSKDVVFKKKDEPCEQRRALLDDDLHCSWDLTSELSEQVHCERTVVANVVRLFDQDNTIPFIARYRQDQTKSMEPEKLREVKEKLEELREVESKIVSVVRKVEKLGKLNESLKSSLLSSRTLDEVDHLYAPFKPTSKKALADRARELGLESYSQQLLTSFSAVNLHKAVDLRKEGLSSVKEVESGVQHIIADVIAKDYRTMDLVRQLCRNTRVLLHSAKCKTRTKDEKGAKTKNKTPTNAKKDLDAEKYELYYAFSCDVKHIQPHQVLAINRGENRKVLTVKVEIPDSVRQRFLDHCKATFVPKGCSSDQYKLIVCSAEDGYKRLIEPLMMRSIRRDLNRTAEKASIAVFAANLKRLLLTPPVRGRCVLGVDPGFAHGCKFTLVSSVGKVEATGVAYLHSRRDGVDSRAEADKISNVLKTYRCETVAIGNGVGCRETEKFFSDAIQSGAFHPLRVVFSIVSEAGASVYSASAEANKELPQLDVSLRGAVSIARRLQDPLAELVKIDPKSIGVGMYQHDVSEKQLKSSLDGVVEECVSFVGADVNVSSEALLRHIAGINSGLAKKIVEYRHSRGPFQNRSQLRTISGLGPKTFEQCAGFLRILPGTRDVVIGLELEAGEGRVGADGKGKKRSAKTQGQRPTKKQKAEFDSAPNNLDMTSIHPESYEIADRLLAMAQLDKCQIGVDEFIQSLKAFLVSINVSKLAEKLSTTDIVLTQITSGLLQRVDQDLRDDYQKPLFRAGVRMMSDLKVGSVVSGKVTNVTHFGAFVDIGVGRDGLIHLKGTANKASASGVQLGNLVEVVVQSLNLERERIGLSLVRVTG